MLYFQLGASNTLYEWRNVSGAFERPRRICHPAEEAQTQIQSEGSCSLTRGPVFIRGPLGWTWLEKRGHLR